MNCCADTIHPADLAPNGQLGAQPSFFLWTAGPLRPVSLWDMLIVSAETFILLMKDIEQVATDIGQMAKRIEDLETRVNRLVENELTDATANEVNEIQKGLNDPVILIQAGMKNEMERVEQQCVRLQLNSGLAQINRMRAAIDSGIDLKSLPLYLTNLSERIQDELKSRLFLFIPSEHAAFFEDKPHFGTKVQDKFPTATADIADAAVCLGTNRATASVFHLMCVMEVGINYLAKRLSVPRNQVDGQTWNTILTNINAKITGMPLTTAREREKRDRYSEAYAHLHAVKNAWRNPTMHSKRRYTQEEAEAIFDHVKTFMNYLATWGK